MGPVFFGTFSEKDNRGAMAFALTAAGELAGVYGTSPDSREPTGGTARSRRRST